MPKITVRGGPTNANEDKLPEIVQVDVPEDLAPEGSLPVERTGTFKTGSIYQDMSYKDLLEELRARRLPRNGNRDELDARLQEDDLRRAE
jgi:hypothetical protein